MVVKRPSGTSGFAVDPERAKLEIKFLGKPALHIDGRLHVFAGPRKAIALLAYVLLNRERALSRAALAEQLWPDEDDASARSTLRRHLHRALSNLPQAAPDRPWIIADKRTLRWNADANVTIDTVEFDRFTASSQFAHAVTLYAGDYLEGFHDDWILPERERLRELHCANLIALADERRRELDYAGAIAFVQALLRLDPLREDAIRRLMSLRFAIGDRSGALTEYETFQERLRTELSVEPMQETIALCEAIRANELDAGARHAKVPAIATNPGFAFVGRTTAFDSLREAWQAAAHGSGSTAIVSGEAGIGKSRLVAELVALIQGQGGRVALGTTAGIETEPYQPIAEALGGALPMVRFERLEPENIAALSSLIPEVLDLVPDARDVVALDPERERRRLFSAIASVFEQLAEKRPLLVVLEDLHWAGAATIALLAFICRRLRGRSILLVISFREEEVSERHALRSFLHRLDAGNSRHVALGPLSPGEVRTLVSRALAASSDEFADGLFSASGGNALYVTELLRHRLTGETTVPQGIAAMVGSSVDRLSPSSRSFLETAAVVGAGFDTDVVRRACGWTFAEAHAALDDVLDRGLAREATQRRGDFAFSHQIVHAAIYEALDENVRKRLHRRVAKTIENLFGDRPWIHATIARHYDAAGFAADAVAAYVRAVRHALDVFGQNEAIALASRALELCHDQRERFELHRLRAEAATQIGDNAKRREDCEAMTAIADLLGDDELLATSLNRTIALFMALGLRDDESQAIEALRVLGERAHSMRSAVEAVLARARLEVNLANLKTATMILAEAEPLVANLADDDLTFEYWYVRAFIAAEESPEVAHRFLAEAQKRAGSHATREARTLRVEAHILILTGDVRVLHAVAERLLELYVEIGDLEGQGNAHHCLAISTWTRFDLDEHREHLRLALAFFERVQKPNSIANELLNHGIFYSNTGAFEEAEAYYRRALGTYEPLAQWNGIGFASAKLAALESLRGNYTRARDLAQGALERARDHGVESAEHFALRALGTAERHLRNFEEARRCFEHVLAYRRSRDPVETIDTLVDAIPAHLGAGAVDAAIAAAEELLHGMEVDRMRATFPAEALWRTASAYAANGDIERAKELRAEARSMLRELAARVSDERTRNGYLSLPGHRDILAYG